MSENYNKKLIPLARTLRKNMTKQESHLWYDFLCDYPFRFQRQKTIDNYIADFYCEEARLVVEIDGSQHYSSQGKEYDRKRTEVLEQYDIIVLRFSNQQVDEGFHWVTKTIDKTVKNRVLTKHCT